MRNMVTTHSGGLTVERDNHDVIITVGMYSLVLTWEQYWALHQILEQHPAYQRLDNALKEQPASGEEG